MSVPVFSITKRDGRSVVVFKRDGVLEGWAYLAEVSRLLIADLLSIGWRRYNESNTTPT
jgi:hypothetical protein